VVYREGLSITRANGEEKPWLPHIRPDYSTLRNERAKRCMFCRKLKKAASGVLSSKASSTGTLPPRISAAHGQRFWSRGSECARI